MICSNGVCVCAVDADCSGGATGSCVGGLCRCGGSLCAPGQRCLQGANCG
jgi:hypothetical protein